MRQPFGASIERLAALVENRTQTVPKGDVRTSANQGRQAKPQRVRADCLVFFGGESFGHFVTVWWQGEDD